MLERITPVILTLNEAPNLPRTLDGLHWARRIVVVDSYSNDETLAILAGMENVHVFQRRFDDHASQWSFALRETGIDSEWVLALDADYVLTPALVEELRRLQPTADIGGYRTAFSYCALGKPLRGSAYPPVTTLYRRANAHYTQDGHTQRVVVTGKVEALHEKIHHDDRKPLGAWLASQAKYMAMEARKLRGKSLGQLSAADRVRRLVPLAPFLMFFYCAVWKRNLLDGRAGLYYSLQRTLAEILLMLYLLEATPESENRSIK